MSETQPASPKRKLPVFANGREVFSYANPFFPMEIYRDDFSMLEDSVLSLHWQDNIEIDCLLQGTLEIRIGTAVYTMEAGDIAVIGQGVLHMMTDVKESGAVTAGTAFKPSLILGDPRSPLYQQCFGKLEQNHFTGVLIRRSEPENESIRQAVGCLDAMRFSPDLYFDAADDLKTISCISDIWRSVLLFFDRTGFLPAEDNASYRSSEEYKAVIQYMHAHLAEKITVEDMAKATGISRSSIFRAFRVFGHATPLDCLREIRLEAAAKMLTESKHSLDFIANSTGFASASYFCNVFRKRYQMTPVEYRKKQV